MASLIVVKYLNPTDTKGARLRVSCGDFKAQTIGYPYGYDGIQAFQVAALAFSESVGWGEIPLLGGWIDSRTAGFALNPYSN